MKYSQLSNYSIIKISGKDNRKFLQGQLTCDLEKLSETHALYGGYSNVQGRLISIFYLFQENEDIFLVAPDSNIEPLLSALKKYAIFSKVEFTQTDLKLFSIWGMDQIKTISNQINIELNEEILSAHHSESIISIRSVTSESSYLLITDDASKLTNQFEQCAECTTPESWKRFLISQKVCELNEHSIEKFLPSEIELTKLKGVSFDKGCFMGQEVIARMHYLGKSKKSLQRIIVTAEEMMSIIPTTRILDQDSKLSGEIAFIEGNQALAIMLNNKLNQEQDYMIEKQLGSLKIV